MFDHGAAGFGAVPARLGAVRHVFVVLELLALRRACVASLRTSIASRDRERALPRGQFGCERAVLRAIHAGVHRLDVLFSPFRDESRAVVEARIAGYLAIGAHFGALDEVLVMRRGLLAPRLAAAQSGEPSQGPNDNRYHT